jgi:hypothetical protein
LIRRGIIRRTASPGQAVFEFVMVLPYFVAVMLLAIEFGVLGWDIISVNNAVRDGARYGSVNCDDPDPPGCTVALIEPRTRDASDGALAATLDPPATVAAWWCERSEPSHGTPWRGDSIVVQATRSRPLMFVPFATFPVFSRVDMLIENDDPLSGVPKSTDPATQPCSY